MKFLLSKSKELLDFIPKQLKTDYWIIVVKRRPWLKKVSWFLGFTMLLAVMGAGVGWYYMYQYTGWDPWTGGLVDDHGQPLDFNKIDKADFKQTTYIYDRTGKITGRLYNEIRDPVRINEVPEILQRAFISAEDKRFYQHSGIDIKAIISAGIGNFLRSKGINIWKRSGGASTITQQLVRLYYADEVSDFKNRTRSLARKTKEAKVAIQIEKRYPKEKILEMFLNLIYLGHGVNGAAEAAYRYQGKDIRKDDLTIKEVAILASMNKFPAIYCPIFHKPAEPQIDETINPETATKLKGEYEEKLAREIIRLANAKDRYNYVLEAMRDNGDISHQEYWANLFKKDESPNVELAHLHSLKNPTYDYSNRMIKEMLLFQGHPDQELTHYGGLRIHTTFDPEIQKIASEEFEKHLVALNMGKNPEDRLNGAFIVIEVKTGNVLALSGGNDFSETQYNRVMASRSPGSGFKPFIYAAAIEYLHKDFFDKICNCPFSMRGGAGKTWAPQNFQEENPVPYGNINFSTGLIRSINLATLNEARTVGMELIVELANSMGVWGNPGIVRDSEGDIWFKKPSYEISGGLVPLLPTAIGASDVNLLELANAYAVFFRNGVYIRPTLVTEVKSTYGDEVIYKPESLLEKKVLSPETSDKMLALMRAVTKVGTAKISMRDIEQEVACKTGTSNGPRDVSIWCGTPELVIAIRFGIDDYRVIELPEYMKSVSGRDDMQITGGWVAGPLARKMIDRIYANRPKVSFSPEVESELQRLLTNPQ